MFEPHKETPTPVCFGWGCPASSEGPKRRLDGEVSASKRLARQSPPSLPFCRPPAMSLETFGKSALIVLHWDHHEENDMVLWG